jgi:hypothetical protein
VGVERLSVELTNRCDKACRFCYSASTPAGATAWSDEDIVGFVRDCAGHGVRAVSFGGGEPLQYPGVFPVLESLRGVLFRSITTNGLRLRGETLERLVAARPDKVHVSIHVPADAARVIVQVTELARRGLRSGVNLLVPRSQLAAMARVAESVRAAGIGNDRIVYLPMRLQDTPSPEEVGRVAGGGPFQSMSCLAACAARPRFCAVGWDRTVAWCSYTRARRRLERPTYEALQAALSGLGLEFCGGKDDERPLRLSRRPLDGHDLVRGGP